MLPTYTPTMFIDLFGHRDDSSEKSEELAFNPLAAANSIFKQLFAHNDINLEKAEPSLSENITSQSKSTWESAKDMDIFELVPWAYAQLASIKEELVRMLGWNLLTQTSRLEPLTEYANHLQNKWGSTKDGTTWNWKEEKDSTMPKIIEKMKEDHIQIDGKDIEKWIEDKEQMTKPDLLLLKETLTAHIDKNSSLSTSVQTKMQQAFQVVTNCFSLIASTNKLGNDTRVQIIRSY